MRAHNERITDVAHRAGFYGLDLYNMSGSIRAVLDYLDEIDPQAAKVARERYGCLTPWQDVSTYGRAVLTAGYKECEQAVIAQMQGPAAPAARLRNGGRGGLSRRSAECPSRGLSGALLPCDVFRGSRVLEPARYAHVRDAKPSGFATVPA